MNRLTFAYPAWMVIFCVVLGLGFAALLYYRDRSFANQPAWLRYLLAVLRGLSIGLIAFFLLEPLLRYRQSTTRKPIVVLAQDASESVRRGWSAPQRQAYFQEWNQLVRTLQRQYEVKQYSFGEKVREALDTTFSDKISNLADFLTTIQDQYAGDNLGAVIMASDGIYNEGNNPLYLPEKDAAPVFTVALGDTTPQKDLVLKRAFYNKIVYLGDQFSVQLDIAAFNCAGSTANLSVSKIEGGKARALQQSALRIERNDFFATREVVIDASQAGIQHYRVVLNKIPGEATTANNVQDIFVEVLDARQKILILAQSPHPDLGALRQSIEVNKNYQVEVDYLPQPKVNVASFDVVILHQLPARNVDFGPLRNLLDNNRIPRWFIVGSQTDFSALNRQQNVVAIQTDGRNTNDVQATVAGNFALFLVDEAWRSDLANFPPIQAPFGEFRAGGSAQVLLYQRIRKIDTQYPLLAFGESNGQRTALLLAEGVWRWRLFDYLQNENHELFDGWISKVIQYLGVKEDKRKFRVTVAKNIFRENDPVSFDGELYNSSYELFNEPDARIVVSGPRGKDYPYTFNKVGRAYQLNAGTLPVGNYRFKATTQVGSEVLSAQGQFSIQPIQLEQYATTADHRLLRLLSARFGGTTVAPSALNTLPDLIKKLDSAKPVIYTQTTNQLLLNLRWLFGVILILLVGEWFLRRYFGSY